MNIRGTQAEIDERNEESRREYERKEKEREAKRQQLLEDKNKGRRKYFFFGSGVSK